MFIPKEIDLVLKFALIKNSSKSNGKKPIQKKRNKLQMTKQNIF